MLLYRGGVVSRPLVSVCMATYERGPLLERALECYRRQDFDTDRFELVVLDDHSRDGTRDLVLDWSRTHRISAVVLTASPKPAEWVDCGTWMNHCIRVSSGDHVILTHPEIMCGRTSVKDCVTALDRHQNSYDIGMDEWRFKHPFGLYVGCRCYYLSPQDQVRIDTVPWKEDGVLALRRIEGFYTDDTNGNPDYSHRATDTVAQPGSRMTGWESFIFSGHSRETWKRLGGFLTTKAWGSCDVGWVHRRRTLGIPTHTPPAETAIVAHQNHDLPGNVPTHRDMDTWVRELRGFDLNDPAAMCYPRVDELGWGG